MKDLIKAHDLQFMAIVKPHISRDLSNASAEDSLIWLVFNDGNLSTKDVYLIYQCGWFLYINHGQSCLWWSCSRL